MPYTYIRTYIHSYIHMYMDLVRAHLGSTGHSKRAGFFDLSGEESHSNILNNLLIILYVCSGWWAWVTTTCFTMRQRTAAAIRCRRARLWAPRATCGTPSTTETATGFVCNTHMTTYILLIWYPAYVCKSFYCYLPQRVHTYIQNIQDNCLYSIDFREF